MTENEKAYRSAGRRRRARPLDLVHMRHVALDHLRGRSLVLMRSITLLAVALAVAFSSVPADAITPATPDGTGHPSVGYLSLSGRRRVSKTGSARAHSSRRASSSPPRTAT